MTITRRHIQFALGALWLLDGALQLQTFMFTAGFSHDILAPSGDGQPHWVSGPVGFFAHHIAQHPAPFNAVMAVAQLALGVGFLLGPTVRAAIVASVLWALGVWWFGEGLGGLASGHATLITGAPGAAVLYAVLALAVWPADPSTGRRDATRQTVSAWLPAAWAALWLGGAALQLLPAQRHANDLATQIASGARGAPGWLAATDRAGSDVLRHLGAAGIALLVALMAAVGLAALVPGRTRAVAAAGGTVLALAFWLVGQNLGELYSGQATDPNTGPLLVLFTVAILGCAAPTTVRSHVQPRQWPAPAGQPTPVASIS